jgi:hypothetical protein
MADEIARPKIGTILFNSEPVVLSAVPLPVIYFDNAPSISHMGGIIGVTLTVTGNVPEVGGGTAVVASVVAHLKCNIPAAIALRDSLHAALLLAAPAENPEGPKN